MTAMSRCLWVWLLLLAWPVQADSLIQARLAGEPFQLELVNDPEQRRQGLMAREALPLGSGMLFDFPPGTRPAIWMRNMRMALDLLFVDESGQVMQIFPDVPPCADLPCAVYQAEQPVRFVIEVPAGTAGKLGLQPGDQLDLGGHQLSSPPAF